MMRRYAFANGLRTEAFSQSSAKPRAAQHGIDVRFGLRIQPIDATHWAKRSAGVSKLSVSLGRSFRRRATALSLF
jgi:hypothetical protein